MNLYTGDRIPPSLWQRHAHTVYPNRDCCSEGTDAVIGAVIGCSRYARNGYIRKSSLVAVLPPPGNGEHSALVSPFIIPCTAFPAAFVNEPASNGIGHRAVFLHPAHASGTVTNRPVSASYNPRMRSSSRIAFISSPVATLYRSGALLVYAFILFPRILYFRMSSASVMVFVIDSNRRYNYI